jgi:hypothetical protein
MRSCVVRLIFCVLAFARLQAVAEGALSFPSKNQKMPTLPHGEISKSLMKTGPHSTLQGHSATNRPDHSDTSIGSPMTGKQTRPSHPPAVSKTKLTISTPTNTNTHRSHSGAQPGSPTHTSLSVSKNYPPTTDKPRSAVSKTKVKAPTSTWNLRSRDSRITPDPPTRGMSSPVYGKTPVPAMASSTITRGPKIMPITASRTVTVSHGETATAQPGWLIVGVGIGGAVSVGGKVVPVAGGVAGIVGPNGHGGEKLSTVHTQTTSTTSSSSSGTPSPTPYNIYPRSGSTAAQLLAFERNLNQIAQRAASLELRIGWCCGPRP